MAHMKSPVVRALYSRLDSLFHLCVTLTHSKPSREPMTKGEKNARKIFEDVLAVPRLGKERGWGPEFVENVKTKELIG